MINVRLTLNFRDGDDAATWKIKLRTEDGVFWLQKIDRFSDTAREAYVFDNRNIAEAVVRLCEDRMRAWDLVRGTCEARRLSVVKFMGQ
jgi:hypothetical protein